MKSYHVLLLSGLLSVSLVGCSNKGEETASENSGTPGGAIAQQGENAGNKMAQKTENAAERTGTAVDNATTAVTNAGVTAKIKNAINLSTVIDNTKSKIDVDT